MALDYSIITLLGSARGAGPARLRKWHRDLSASPRSESRGCCPSSSPSEDHRVLPARPPVAAEFGYALALVNWIYDSSFQMSAKAQATTGRFLTTPNPENSTRCAHLSARCVLWRAAALKATDNLKVAVQTGTSPLLSRAHKMCSNHFPGRLLYLRAATPPVGEVAVPRSVQRHFGESQKLYPSPSHEGSGFPCRGQASSS